MVNGLCRHTVHADFPILELFERHPQHLHREPINPVEGRRQGTGRAVLLSGPAPQSEVGPAPSGYPRRNGQGRSRPEPLDPNSTVSVGFSDRAVVGNPEGLRVRVAEGREGRHVVFLLRFCGSVGLQVHPLIHAPGCVGLRHPYPFSWLVPSNQAFYSLLHPVVMATRQLHIPLSLRQGMVSQPLLEHRRGDPLRMAFRP